MGESQTWRVVLASGEVLSVEAWPDANVGIATGQGLAVIDIDPRSGGDDGIVDLRRMYGELPETLEVLAPGEPTRSELAAQLAAATAERDVRRAQQAPILDAHDALVAAARAAGWTGAGATGAELVAWVRRGAMRECLAVARAEQGVPDCTGITAQWCPRCGDCTCPALHEGGDPGERTLDDPACPLHAPSSPHGDAPGGAT